MKTGKLWQGLGLGIDTQDINKALKDTHLDFEVKFSDIKTNKKLEVKDFKANEMVLDHIHSHIGRMTYRIDTGQELGIVGNGYELLQNSEVFDFVHEIINCTDKEGEKINKNAKIEKTGIFFHGAQSWMTIDLGDPIKIGPHSLKRYILMTWSFNGTWAFSARFVCVNTVSNTILSAPIKKIKDEVRIRHTRNVKNRVQEAAKILIAAEKYFTEAEECFEILALTSIEDHKIKSFLNELFPETGSKRGDVIAKNRKNDIWGIIQTGQGMKEVSNSLWAIYNGVSQYETFHKKTRKVKLKTDEEARLHSVFFGQKSNDLTRETFKRLMEITE